MAIINCPECGKEISDKAKICINCGYPINSDLDNIQPKPDNIELKQENVDPVLPNWTPQGSYEKSHPKSKKIIVTVIIFAMIAIITSVVIIIINENTLSFEEEQVYNVASIYKKDLKNPNSMELHGDAAFIIDKDFNYYTFFTVSGNNSYGTKAISVAMFKNSKYIGNYDNKGPDYDATKEEKAEYTLAESVLWQWALDGENLTKEKGYNKAVKVNCKKIANRFGCKYVEIE